MKTEKVLCSSKREWDGQQLCRSYKQLDPLALIESGFERPSEGGFWRRGWPLAGEHLAFRLKNNGEGKSP